MEFDTDIGEYGLAIELAMDYEHPGTCSELITGNFTA
jgi:hypothetical protein